MKLVALFPLICLLSINVGGTEFSTRSGERGFHAQRVAAADQSNRRVALVIGNGKYTDAPLKNPVNDAAGMARSFNSSVSMSLITIIFRARPCARPSANSATRSRVAA